MDVRQLLLLAGGNSALAKKKVDRLTAQDGDDDPKISGDAVAAYLSKQKAFKNKIKAQEDEARKRRIQARLDASLGKPTRREKKMVEKEKAVNGHFLPGDKRSQDVEKDKMKKDKGKDKGKEKLKESKKQYRYENGERPKSSKSSEHRKRSQTPESSIPKKKMKSDKDRDKSESSKSRDKEKNGENGEKRYRRRIPDNFETSIHEERLKEKERNALLSKEKAKKKAKASSSNPNAGLSFTDLLKLAKNNASSARLADDGTLIVKKKEKVKSYDDENTGKKVKGEYEKIRDMQKKMKKEDSLKRPKQRDSYDESPPSKSKHEYHKSKSKHYENGNDNDYMRKEKKKMNNNGDHHKSDKFSKERSQNDPHSKHNSDHISSSSSKHKQDVSHSKHKSNKDTSRGKYVEDSPSPKRGLIAQTISTKKNGSLSKVKPQRPSGIEAQFRGVKPSGIEAQFMKINQQKSKMKKRLPMPMKDDYEDQFQKEARELARKRKLFEMQRVTGNSNLVEEDVMSDNDYYDLSEEEDEDDDDFIDDSEPVENISKYIRKITGYDRRLYDDSDDDNRHMESSYSQIEKEELRSSRIAREEDRIAALEEAAELAREKAMEEARIKKKGKR